MKNSGSRRIAERYVKALFDVAFSAKALDAVEADMASLGKALDESPEFAHFLTNPLVARKNQAQAMLDVLAKMNAHELTRRFIGMLSAQQRLGILRDIAALFSEAAMKARGEMTAELITAAPMKDKEIQQITSQLGQAYGKKVTVEARTDADLLGGIVINIGSLQLDASLAGKLERLKTALQAA